MFPRWSTGVTYDKASVTDNKHVKAELPVYTELPSTLGSSELKCMEASASLVIVCRAVMPLHKLCLTATQGIPS